MTYTPEQARDWCYEARNTPVPLSIAMSIIKSLADQVERLTADNLDLRTPKSLLPPLHHPSTFQKWGL